MFLIKHTNMTGSARLILAITLQLSLFKEGLSQCSGGASRCEWVPWNAWSQCNRSCGGGTRVRDRPLCCRSNIPSFDACVEECGLRRSDCCQEGSCNTHCYNGGSFRNSRCNCREANFGSCCQDTIECGHPGNIANGRVIGNNFYFGHSVTYTCNAHYNLTGGDWRRTCQRRSSSSNVGVWSGRQPRCAFVNSCESNPCQNSGTCVNGYDRYDCDCSTGWSGRHCELDILPPSMENCHNDRQHFTDQIRKHIDWEEPRFYDPFGNDVTVTSNYPTSSAVLWWGDNIVKYTGRKENNALTTTCSFNEALDPHPCGELPAPDNGAVTCNGWNTRFSRVCAYFCQEDLTFGPGNDIRQLLVCGADGSWAPRMPVANCSRPRIRRESNHHFTGTCTDAIATINENFISILTSPRSQFHQLCDEFPDACAPEYVNVSCHQIPELTATSEIPNFTTMT